MIQKRNISTFAIGLCLLAFMLLSASPAKALKFTDSNMKKAYEKCLTKKKVKNMKACFKNFSKTHKSACVVDKRITKSNVGLIFITNGERCPAL